MGADGRMDAGFGRGGGGGDGYVEETQTGQGVKELNEEGEKV